ncbi:hypothetical protein BJX96DRAFT_159832 [Aspergillus floccosus]
MAILDKESRRLRMPSLSAMKLQKKSTPPSPESPPRKDPPPVSAVPQPPVYPARSDSVPVRPPRPQEKELPPNPMLQNTSPPFFPSAASSPPPAPFSNPTHPYNDRPLPSFPRVPVPRAADPVPVQQSTPPPSDGSEPEPERITESSTRMEDVERKHAPVAPAQAPAPAPTPRYQPYQPREQPPVAADEDDDPLEDYIPDPEPELDGPGDAVEIVSSGEDDTGPWTPPDYEPVAPPLNKLHYACYQEHRAMLPAQNMWYPLPCMACQKFDRETRFRCVFCCLRVCGACHEGLRKSPHRSLARWMETLPGHGRENGQASAF